MKKRLLLASIILLMLPMATNAFFVDGGQWAEFMLEYEKSGSGNRSEIDWVSVNKYSYYVVGVYDALNLYSIRSNRLRKICKRTM